MEKRYGITKNNLAHTVIENLQKADAFGTDPLCSMSEQEIQKFWTYFTIDLLHRLRTAPNNTITVDDLLKTGTETAREILRRDFESRMGTLRISTFYLFYLMPALASAIHEDLARKWRTSSRTNAHCGTPSFSTDAKDASRRLFSF